jgi:trans-2,3-dihydro-3-hydroxyanthranilate isomerase
MALDYSLLDVFADAPFQGTQIPVVVLDGGDFTDKIKTAIASEFQQTETVFVEAKNTDCQVSVYNGKGRAFFGAHTILAASYVAYEMGLTKDEGAFSSFQLSQNDHTIDSFIDNKGESAGAIQFARMLSPTVDRYTPELARLAAALNLDEKHLSFSKYRPMVVSVDHPTLIVPVTRPEHVLSASINAERWADLMSEIYTSELFLFAPGSITGASDFHGRLLNPDLARDVFPPIGNMMPEFVAYLAEQAETAEGTHTLSIDRGSKNTRQSVLHAEFDKRSGRGVRCRIGGNVIKMGVGSLLV